MWRWLVSLQVLRSGLLLQSLLRGHQEKGEMHLKPLTCLVWKKKISSRCGPCYKKYCSVFSLHEGDVGCTDLVSHDIPLLDEVPVRQWYRHIPPSDYEAVKAHFNQLLEHRVIRESCSPYASPIVLAKKKDGS